MKVVEKLGSGRGKLSVLATRCNMGEVEMLYDDGYRRKTHAVRRFATSNNPRYQDSFGGNVFAESEEEGSTPPILSTV